VTSRPRYVLDTNVIVSALLFPNSVPSQAFLAAGKHGEVILSEDAVGEIAQVLRRPKFDRYVLPEERDWFLATLIRRASIVAPVEKVRMCRDPNDDKWLEIAVAGEAERVISGDNDLLCLQQFRAIQIVTPAQFLASLAP
jgi:putative PIN family toxin of toxin-antitoxin system